MTCSFFGDVGDLLAAMASFQRMYPEGIDLVLYPAPGRCREPMTPAKVDSLRPLLELQPYIRSVRYSDHPEGRILDDWRKLGYPRLVNLADMFARWAGVPHADRNTPWLRVDYPTPVAPVVIHRSPRYREGSTFPWRRVLDTYRGHVVMTGLPEEHEAFCREIGDVPYHPTPDLLALARVLCGARLVVCNQTSVWWISTGSMIPMTWLEQNGNRQNNCHWERDGAIYDRAEPPELKLEAPAALPLGGRVANLDRLGVVD